jgi:hypothetical protein
MNQDRSKIKTQHEQYGNEEAWPKNVWMTAVPILWSTLILFSNVREFSYKIGGMSNTWKQSRRSSTTPSAS